MSVNSPKKFTQTKGLTDLNFRVNIKGHCNHRKQIFGHKLNNSYGKNNIIQTAKVFRGQVYTESFHSFTGWWRLSTSRQNICRIVFSDLLCIQYARDMHLFFSAFLAV